MNLNEMIDRAQKVLSGPKQVWPAIKMDGESATEVYRNYLIYLAIIPALATFIGESMVGYAVPFESKVLYVPLGRGLLGMVLRYLLILAGVYAAAWLIAAIAPKFEGSRDVTSALKLVGYSATAGWLASALYIIPRLGDLSVFGYVYSAYVLFIGVPIMMESSEEKSTSYAIVSLAITLVSMIIVSMIVNAVLR